MRAAQKASPVMRGFAKLPNYLVAWGILAHLRPVAVKVYLALLHAARSGTMSCFPSIDTLARWSGVPAKRVSAETAYLERHGMIRKGWIRRRTGGTPRLYHVLGPADPEFPRDLRSGCGVCRKVPCGEVVRDPVSGRLRGKRAAAPGTVPEYSPGALVGRRDSADTRPERRGVAPSDSRLAPSMPDPSEPKHSEADEKVLSTRGGGVGEPGGALRSAPPLEAAPLRAPELSGCGQGVARIPPPSDRAEQLRTLFAGGQADLESCLKIARKARYTEAEITEALAIVKGAEQHPASQED